MRPYYLFAIVEWIGSIKPFDEKAEPAFEFCSGVIPVPVCWLFVIDYCMEVSLARIWVWGQRNWGFIGNLLGSIELSVWWKISSWSCC